MTDKKPLLRQELTLQDDLGLEVERCVEDGQIDPQETLIIILTVRAWHQSRDRLGKIADAQDVAAYIHDHGFEGPGVHLGDARAEYERLKAQYLGATGPPGAAQGKEKAPTRQQLAGAGSESEKAG